MQRAGVAGETSTTQSLSSGTGIARLLSSPRSRIVFLQSLVGIILSYQFLFGEGAIISRGFSEALVVGFLLIGLGLMLVPKRFYEQTWLPSMLIAVNTCLVTATIYLSGNASSELYLTYFLLLMIATSVRTLARMLALSLVLCVGYGIVVYAGMVDAGTVSVGHLLGLPILLVMAIFYGVTLETMFQALRQNETLKTNLHDLKQSGMALEERQAQLVTRVQGLKHGLSRANQELRHGQVERQGLERQLREAQKMEAVGRLAAGIATEFNQLLAVIGNQTGTILSRIKQDDPLHIPVDEILRSGERAAALTARLLSLSAGDDRIHEVVALGSVVTELGPVLEGMVPAAIQLRLAVDPAPAFIEIDRDQLELVLLHLVANGREAMSQHGELQIEARIVSGEQLPSDALERNPKKRMAMVTVTDTGRGMNWEVQNRMFEPFFSTSEEHAGLGLTMVYGIVRHYGGSVQVESQPGRGTTVRAFFPLIEGNGQRLPRKPGAIEIAGSHETVLLVEEDEIERKLARSTLTRHDYRVLEAASAVEALLVAQQYSGRIHLTVSQLVMPDISGRELARRLLVHHPTMKAVFVSGYSDDTIIRHRVNKRFHLQRPYRQQALIEKVAEVLQV